MASTYKSSIQKARQCVSDSQREFIGGEGQKLNRKKITPPELTTSSQINFTLARGIIARKEPIMLF